MNLSDLNQFVGKQWRDDLTARLFDYVKVPAKSPAFDASWQAHGYLQQVIQQAHDWARAQPAGQTLKGMTIEIVAMPGKTPCILFDIPATHGLGNTDTILFYGHLDKQPEMTGWREDLGPWKPLIENGKLYGRGSADDGYAIYAALTAIAAVDKQNAARPRCVGLIESGEESGSPDLPEYIQALRARLGNVKLVVGLDSGCGNYDQMWVTTSLRGLIGGTLTVEILTEGVHSGMASGIVPSSFRIARQLLNRVDDPRTGEVLAPQFHAQLPPGRLKQIHNTAAILGDAIWKSFPWVSCNHEPAAHAGAQFAQPTSTDPVECLLNRTWRPALSVTGAAGLPSLDSAGNVLRPKTQLKLSMRIPPTVDGFAASRELKKLLEQDSPYGARVTFKEEGVGNGWNAPETAPWLNKLLIDASERCFAKPPGWMGEGGTIPFMNMLGKEFPQAQFLITGVLGPHSNAHGPNEFLHLDYAQKLTSAVALVVAGMATVSH
jgi:acetylornithine deacetylase/succinyl-diaminopimelate desuccinylase-like protein